ncbi:hypothetical protein LCGC14_0947820 [marine sediment metagenome]|uniref:Uncharacterized protein n=1 Tax=marine sediment metagenome TaxID=412755 RepID=A0A0F9P495_9ZZZZ
MKLIINDVPEDCKDEVLRLAAVAIDRYYRKHHETVDAKTLVVSGTAKDDFRLANGLKKMYYPDIEPDPTFPELE